MSDSVKTIKMNWADFQKKTANEPSGDPQIVDLRSWLKTNAKLKTCPPEFGNGHMELSQDILDVLHVGLSDIGPMSAKDQFVLSRILARLTEIEQGSGYEHAFAAAQKVALIFATPDRSDQLQ